MSKPDTLHVLGKHLVGALSGIYIAAFIARLISFLWPSAQSTTFIIASLVFVLAELSVTIRELYKGRLSTGVFVLDSMPFLLMALG